MNLLGGVDHLHVITPDLDRLLEFYRSVFGAPTVLERTEDGARHALIDVGAGALIEALERRDGPATADGLPMFERGAVNRFALAAPTRHAFLELRRRVMEAGAGDGRVRDVGFLWTFHFRDPDGVEGEVVWRKPGIPASAAPPRGQWTTLTADELGPVR